MTVCKKNVLNDLRKINNLNENFHQMHQKLSAFIKIKSQYISSYAFPPHFRSPENDNRQDLKTLKQSPIKQTRIKFCKEISL